MFFDRVHFRVQTGYLLHGSLRTMTLHLTAGFYAISCCVYPWRLVIIVSTGILLRLFIFCIDVIPLVAHGISDVVLVYALGSTVRNVIRKEISKPKRTQSTAIVSTKTLSLELILCIVDMCRLTTCWPCACIICSAELKLGSGKACIRSLMSHGLPRSSYHGCRS